MLKLKKAIKIISLVLSVIVLILIITNPSANEFKNYLGDNTPNKSVRRTANLFVFSVYANMDYDKYGRLLSKKEYYGVAGNFFENIPPVPNYVHFPIHSANIEAVDTVKKSYTPSINEIEGNSLSSKRKIQLDTNIRKMIKEGATQQDIMAYANDFKNRYSQDIPVFKGGVLKVNK